MYDTTYETYTYYSTTYIAWLTKYSDVMLITTFLTSARLDVTARVSYLTDYCANLLLEFYFN